MTSLNRKIKSEFNTLMPDSDWSFKAAGRLETNRYTHGYHRYPAKFIPNIVERLIRDYTTEDSIVCDPFGGCGTTLVEAKLLHRKSIGFDINPIAKLITQTKTTSIKPKTLNKAIEDFKIKLDNTRKFRVDHDARIYYWFDEKTVQELDRIYFEISQIKNYKIRRIFLCAFSHILKNCSRWLMKSIKPTIDKEKIIPSPQDIFFSHLQSMAKKNEKFYHKLNDENSLYIPARMRLRDSTKKLPLDNESIDLIITSPPYVTSYEYADLHQLSLIWFNDTVHTFKKWDKFANDYNNFRKKFIGSKYKKVRKGDYLSIAGEAIINTLSQKNKRLATNVSNYFIDMGNSFKEMYRILKKNGKACIIIGNTSLRNIHIANAQVAAEQMQKIGFKKITYLKREIPNKRIAPWRDIKNGRFTNLKNPDKKRIYEFEYIIIMQK